MRTVIDEYSKKPYCIEDHITGQLAWGFYDYTSDDHVIVFYIRGAEKTCLPEFNKLENAYEYLKAQGWVLQMKRSTFTFGHYSLIYELIRQEAINEIIAAQSSK